MQRLKSMFFGLVSVDEVIPDPCETSKCKVQQAGFTAWVVQKGRPPETKGQQTIPSEAKEELPGSLRGSE